MKKIAIIGAGISGLFIANLFKKNSDYQVVIYEKNNSINLEEGYGIQLSVNSVKLLNEIEFNKSNLFEADFLDINSSKSRTKLKWETKYSGSKMIEKTIDWYKVFINEPSKIEQFSKKQILDYFSYKIN